jgi:hypothetical protein
MRLFILGQSCLVQMRWGHICPGPSPLLLPFSFFLTHVAAASLRSITIRHRPVPSPPPLHRRAPCPPSLPLISVGTTHCTAPSSSTIIDHNSAAVEQHRALIRSAASHPAPPPSCPALATPSPPSPRSHRALMPPIVSPPPGPRPRPHPRPPARRSRRTPSLPHSLPSTVALALLGPHRPTPTPSSTPSPAATAPPTPSPHHRKPRQCASFGG